MYIKIEISIEINDFVIGVFEWTYMQPMGMNEPILTLGVLAFKSIGHTFLYLHR